MTYQRSDCRIMKKTIHGINLYAQMAPTADAKALCVMLCAPAPGPDPAAPTQLPWGPSGGCQQDGP